MRRTIDYAFLLLILVTFVMTTIVGYSAGYSDGVEAASDRMIELISSEQEATE